MVEPITLPTNQLGTIKYHRKIRFIWHGVISFVISIFLFFILISNHENRPNGIREDYSIDEILALKICLIVFVALQIFTHGLYLILNRKFKIEEYSVVGPYLQIKSFGFINADRKIHFKDLADYKVVEGPIMRSCGIKSIYITCSPGPNGIAYVRLLGIEDAEKWRDVLIKLDAERENSKN